MWLQGPAASSCAEEEGSDEESFFFVQASVQEDKRAHFERVGWKMKVWIVAFCRSFLEKLHRTVNRRPNSRKTYP